MKTEEQLKKDVEDSIILRESPRFDLHYFAAVNKFKSIGRAIRRGNVTEEGIIMPKKPYNNRANTSRRKGVHSRTFNQKKKSIYAELSRYGKKYDFFN